MRQRRRNPNAGSPLTAWEWVGLQSAYNLADAHAQGVPTSDYVPISDRCAEIFYEARTFSQDEIEERFLEAFARLSGQQICLPHVYMYYSSSIAIETVGKAVHELGAKRVGLIHPTFDNIPALLSRAGLELEPVSERILSDEAYLERVTTSLDVLFLVIPNNPTGTSVAQRQLERIVECCGRKGIILALDFSFRFFDASLRSWNQYEVVQRLPSAKVMLLEDTGKTFPLHELKIGLLTPSESLIESIERATDEVLLNVSPVILSALRLATDAETERMQGGLPMSAVEVVDANRRYLREALATTRFSPVNSGSSISVELIDLTESVESASATKMLAAWGVATLPGIQFFWRSPQEGHSYIRISLFRSESYFRAACDRLVAALIELEEDLQPSHREAPYRSPGH